MEGNMGAGSLTKFYALVLLSKKERSGYELMGEIGRALGKRPSAGQIYPLLAKMKKAGYLEEGKKGAREKKSYTLTPKGRGAVREMLGRTGGLVAAVLENKLVACEHCGCVIYENAYGKSVRGKMHYFCCASCAGNGKGCGNCK